VNGAAAVRALRRELTGLVAVASLLLGACGDDGSDFDVERWRVDAQDEFGPEEEHPDGSKDDYVVLATAICDQDDSTRQTMLDNLGADFEGSMQQYILKTFCPNV